MFWVPFQLVLLETVSKSVESLCSSSLKPLGLLISLPCTGIGLSTKQNAPGAGRTARRNRKIVFNLWTVLNRYHCFHCSCCRDVFSCLHSYSLAFVYLLHVISATDLAFFDSRERSGASRRVGALPGVLLISHLKLEID